MRTGKKVHTHIFNDDIYRFGWMIVYGGTLQKAVNRFAKKVGIKPWKVGKEFKRREAHFTAQRDCKSGLIWFPSLDPLPSYGTVAHECFHGVMHVMSCMDVKAVTDETEEFFAYYIGWLVNKIVGSASPKRAKKK